MAETICYDLSSLVLKELKFVSYFPSLCNARYQELIDTILVTRSSFYLNYWKLWQQILKQAECLANIYLLIVYCLTL